MATRPSSSATDILQDAKQLAKTAKERLPAILKADKAKQKKAGTNLTTVAALEKAIRDYQGKKTAQGSKAATAKSATKKEIAARAALALELPASIRDDVEDSFTDDIALQEAFGRGTRLDGKVTNPLLDAADAYAASYASQGAEVKSAGVTASRMEKLAGLRAKLADADGSQRTSIGSRVDSTSAKQAALEAIRKLVVRIRARLAKAAQAAAKAAGAVKGSAKKAKGALANTSPRKKSKKRAAKKTASTGS